MKQKDKKAQDESPEYDIQTWFEWVFKGFDYQSTDCTLTLIECYYSSQFMSFTDLQQINEQEFLELMIAVYIDLKSMDGGLVNLKPVDYVRGFFDTPFYGGHYIFRNELTQSQELKAYDTTMVCISSQCSNRNDINYFAQGMWGAASGQTLEQTLTYAEGWKQYKGTVLSSDARYWLEYGYNQYDQFDSINLIDSVLGP